MSKSKPYEEQKTENQMASEAAMMYETARSMDDFVASIPVDLMQQLIDISIRDCKAGKGITWSPAATDDFLSILKKVDELFGKMIAIKVSNKIQLHIGLLSSFPQIGVRDAIFSTADRDVRYLINTPNLIYYAIEQEEIYIISICDSRQSPETIRQRISGLLRQYK